MVCELCEDEEAAIYAHGLCKECYDIDCNLEQYEEEKRARIAEENEY